MPPVRLSSLGAWRWNAMGVKCYISELPGISFCFNNLSADLKIGANRRMQKFHSQNKDKVLILFLMFSGTNFFESLGNNLPN